MMTRNSYPVTNNYLDSSSSKEQLLIKYETSVLYYTYQVPKIKIKDKKKHIVNYTMNGQRRNSYA